MEGGHKTLCFLTFILTTNNMSIETCIVCNRRLSKGYNSKTMATTFNCRYEDCIKYNTYNNKKPEVKKV